MRIQLLTLLLGLGLCSQSAAQGLAQFEGRDFAFAYGHYIHQGVGQGLRR